MIRTSLAVLAIAMATGAAFAEPAAVQDGDDCPGGSVTVRDIFANRGAREVCPNWKEINKHPLGSARNPVRCEMPAGEHAYLARLRCPGAAAPRFSRDGSTGLSPYGAIMDIYSVRCPPEDGLGERVGVYMDMYHPGYVEERPVPGFTIVPPPGERPPGEAGGPGE